MLDRYADVPELLRVGRDDGDDKDEERPVLQRCWKGELGDPNGSGSVVCGLLRGREGVVVRMDDLEPFELGDPFGRVSFVVLEQILRQKSDADDVSNEACFLASGSDGRLARKSSQEPSADGCSLRRPIQVSSSETSSLTGAAISLPLAVRTLTR